MPNIKVPPMVNPFPVSQQDYRHYLPSAYDPSLNIYETLVNMRAYLNEVIDSQNELIQQWIDLQKWINETLETYTREQIERMLADGTFDELINDKLFKDLEIRMNNRVNQAVKDMNDKVNSIVSSSPVDVVETVEELNSKYPNGRTGIVVVKADGYYYYYQNNQWNKGGLYVDPLSYSMLKKDGTATNLNLSATWKENPDITTLKSGYYTVYVQNKPENPEYPVAINFPPNINGNICLVTVVEHGNEGRTDYKLTINAVNTNYTATKTLTGEMTEWSYTVEHSDSKPKQQYQLTFADGTVGNWKYGTTNADQQTRDDLIVPIGSLNSKFYYGQINKPDEGKTEDRGLPNDIYYGQFYSAIIWRTASNRKTIILNANFGGISWIGYYGTNNTLQGWRRIDDKVDPLRGDKSKFAFKVNVNKPTFRHLIMTDIHAQIGVGETQIDRVNTSHYDNFIDLSKLIENISAECCLGDWFDGNYSKEKSSESIVDFSKKFYSKPNRYGVYGNHDYNCQWDGQAGNNASKARDLNYMLKREEIDKYFTPSHVDKGYYFIDDSKNKIRMIFLSSFDLSYKLDSSGKTITDPLNQRMIGGKQIEWLVKTLQEKPSNYNVVIYTHETFDNVFSDDVYFNGDTARKIAEGFQSKKKDTYSASDITETHADYDYFKCDGEFDFTGTDGKILAVVSGHRHVDNTKFQGGIRYISLLCSKAESGSTPQKPKRNYFDVTQDALNVLDFDVTNEKINLYRFGAGQDYTFNMFS